MEAKFCPFCQRKNKPDAIRCAHCGVLLIAHKPGAFTTMSVSSPLAAQISDRSNCAERIGHIPPESFALFLLDFSEPIILKNHPQIMIGRENQPTEKTAVLDMSRYGDMAQGISRHHALIRYENNAYFIEDLGSTNGTWLNRSRLQPGKPYPLRNDDQIWLGPLKLVFCFAPADPERYITFYLHMSDTLAESGQHLTPDFMVSEVTPYLQALSHLEEARAACMQESVEPLSILSMEGKPAYIQVEMDGLSQTAKLIDKWVIRWRDEHLEMVNATGDEKHWQEQLRPLAIRMVEYLQPTLPAKETEPLAEAFIAPLARLVTSPLEFSRASRQ